MSSRNTLLQSAVAGVLALGLAQAALAQEAKNPPEKEKCYGIAKAGKNDCQTANSSCAGTSKRDKQGDAWIYVPKGTCDRVVEGSLQAKK